MKYTTITTLAALLFATASASAATAYTNPSGFVTHTLKAGQFNLIGLTLHQPIAVAGAFETVSGTTLTDTGVDFTSALTAGKTYVLEITANPADPSLVGTIQEITSWTATTLTTPQDLDAEGLAGETLSGENDGAKYQVRAAKTVSDIFGSANTAGLAAGSSTSADVIWVAAGGGNFKKYYYSDGSGFGLTQGWRNTSTGNDDQANAALPYLDAFFVQRRGVADLDLVVTGAVKTVATSVALTDSFNFVGGVYPVGSTLENSGLEAVVLKGDSTTADVIWVPNGIGGYLKYYYSDGSGFGLTAGWRRVDTGNTDAKAEELKSGLIIQRRAASPYNANIAPPADWDLE